MEQVIIYIPKWSCVYNLKNYNEFHNNYCDASILFLGNFSETELQSTNYYMKDSIEKIKNITNVSDIFCITINTDDFDSYINLNAIITIPEPPAAPY